MDKYIYAAPYFKPKRFWGMVRDGKSFEELQQQNEKTTWTYGLIGDKQ